MTRTRRKDATTEQSDTDAAELVVDAEPAVEPSAEAETSDAHPVVEIEADPLDLTEPCVDQPLTARVEALLLGADRPLSEGRVAEILALAQDKASAAVRSAIEELNQQYQQTGRSFRIDKVAGGWQVLTLATFGPILSRLHRERQEARLSQAALETLAIIAYRQPILRSEIESIRGVACGEVLRSLLERRMIKVVGRAEEIGRPMLYGTTHEFLKVFGLAGVSDLPPLQGQNGAAKGRDGKAAAATQKPESTPSRTMEPDHPHAGADAQSVEVAQTTDQTI